MNAQLTRPAPVPVQSSVEQKEQARVLKLEGLTKRFGSLTAVDGLTLDVRAGEVVGLLGPNGAGKTTTVGMVLGLVVPTAGRIELLGQDLRAGGRTRQRQVGAIIEQPAFYPYLSGRDNLRIIAGAVGGVPRGRIDELLALVDLTESAGRTYKTYSLGMKQRLGIASTLLTDPALIILDEPSNGLDPAGQREVRELIPQLARQGHAVLLASHLLHEVEQVADRVVIIQQGKLVASGPVQVLLRGEGYVEVEIDDTARAADIIRTLPFVNDTAVHNGHIDIRMPPRRGADVIRALAAERLYPSALTPRTSSLEDIFFELTEGDSATENTDERSASHDTARA